MSFSDAELIKVLPAVRARLQRMFLLQSDDADDLSQTVAMKALAHRDQFKTGTNLRAWLITIGYNDFLSQMRRQKRVVADVDGINASKLSIGPAQHHTVELKQALDYIDKLPEEFSSVLIGVGVLRKDYDQAAEEFGIAVGTVKSRLNRARARMSKFAEAV